MNKLKLLISAGLFVLSATTLSAVTPQQSDSLHTKVWSVYAQGGVSMAKGLEIENVDPSQGTDIAALYGLGVSYQFRPWFRLSLNYEYTKYNREQRFSNIQQFTTPRLRLPNMELVETKGGLAYYKAWTGYHNIDLTADFNILELWKNRQKKWFNLYLSTGFGYSIANGNGYDVAMGSEIWRSPGNYVEDLQVANNHEIYSWVEVNNEKHDYKAPYIPVNLSAEFDVSPRITLGAKLMYKYVISDEYFAPDHMLGAVGTIRLNFVGAKHGYRSDKNRLSDLRNSYAQLLSDYNRAKKECEDNAKAQADRIKRLEDDNDLLRRNLAECEAREPQVVECKPEISVQFMINSDVIGNLEKVRLMDFIKQIEPDSKITLQLVGEASVDGKDDYNQKLSERRLKRVLDMLKANGISEDRISRTEAIGASSRIDDPIARRVTIRVD